jgi:salicylate hydroxylase
MILFCKISTPWPDTNRLLATCHRSTAQAAVSAWKPDVRGVVDLLPETPTKWAIFDMSAHPAKTYTKGRVCIAGDAAHASTPFLASGAAMGVEDAAVLAATLETALNKPDTGKPGEKTAAITAAFRAFSALRLERSQMVVRYSREVGEMCMWRDEEVGRDPKRCFEEIWRRYCDVWEFDVPEMVEGARKECRRLLEGGACAKTSGSV